MSIKPSNVDGDNVHHFFSPISEQPYLLVSIPRGYLALQAIAIRDKLQNQPS